MLAHQSLFAEFKLYDDEYLGEYYEYNVYSKKHSRVIKATKKVIKYPIKKIYYSGVYVDRKVKNIVARVKRIIQRHDPFYGKDKQRIDGALSDWQELLDDEPQGINYSKRNFITYFPKKALKLLKEVFYTVGVEIPFAILHGIEGAIYGGIRGISR